MSAGDALGILAMLALAACLALVVYVVEQDHSVECAAARHYQAPTTTYTPRECER
jgi:hypothetical protein